jgi:protein arginine kinase activator
MDSLCQHCQQERATVLVTDNFPEKRERHLCEECAMREGVIFKQKNTSHEILQQFIKAKASIEAVSARTCPTCGMTLKEFQKRGLLGCPNDYDVFGELLTPLIHRAHAGATHHVGKVPPGLDESARKRTSLRRLRRELQEAVELEDYELAASVRDRIKELDSA